MSPEAWLLTTARRQLGKSERHARVVHRNEAELTRHIEEALEAMTHGEDGMADERLKLLFVCAHPAIAAEAQTPLMLQTVIGLDAARIARAFVVPPATMSQRLVRAKARIRDTGIRFAIPDTAELPARLDAVLQAIYAAFSAGWDAMDGDAGGELSEDAIWLGRTLVQLMPQQTEAQSLLALMLHCHARRAARRRGDAFVPLAAQDTALWDDGLMRRGRRAAGHGQPGRRLRPVPVRGGDPVGACGAQGHRASRRGRPRDALCRPGAAGADHRSAGCRGRGLPGCGPRAGDARRRGQ